LTTKALIINSKKQLTQRIFEFICNVDKKFVVEKALLFGSTAKAKRKPESDVDLIIVSESFNGLTSLERNEQLLELWPYVEELELLAYTLQEFALIKDRMLMKEILSYAIDLKPKSPHKAKLNAAKCKSLK
jgi:predicted nucleotidyltransferase